MEVKNNINVDPDDTVTWISYVIEGSPIKRSKLSDDKWEKAIAKKITMIIVDKNESTYILV
jgi:hypothetical protein